MYERLFSRLNRNGRLKLKGEFEFLRSQQGNGNFFESISLYRMRNYHESVYRSGVSISWILARISGKKPSILLTLPDTKGYPVPPILLLLRYLQHLFLMRSHFPEMLSQFSRWILSLFGNAFWRFCWASGQGDIGNETRVTSILSSLSMDEEELISQITQLASRQVDLSLG